MEQGVLPLTLQSLNGWDLLNPITQGLLPDSLTYIKFGDGHKQEFDQGSFPYGLLEIANFSPHNIILPGQLPPLLQSLSFNDFDMVIPPGVLPPTLLSLDLGDVFNQEILNGALPSSLTKLRAGLAFNMPILEGVLPSQLTTLIVTSYSHPLPTLPTTITHLDLGTNFDHQIHLQNGLTWLSIILVLPALLASTFPSSLRVLKFGPGFNAPIPAGVLPLSLTKLSIGDLFNQPITAGSLPPSITVLRFGESFDNVMFPAGALPTSLVSLTLRNHYLPKTMRLPPTIKYLKIHKFIAKWCLPKYLDHLSIIADNQFLSKKNLSLKTLSMELHHPSLRTTMKLYRSLEVKVVNIGTYSFNYNGKLYSIFTRMDGDWIMVTVARGPTTEVMFHNYDRQPRPMDTLSIVVIRKIFDLLKYEYIDTASLGLTCKRLFVEMHNRRQQRLKVTPKLDGLNGVVLEDPFVVLYYNKSAKIKELPSKLTHLEFGPNYDKFLPPGRLPPMLTSLAYHIGEEKRMPTVGINYNRLFGSHGDYTYLVAKMLPPSITSLTLGSSFDQIIEPGLMPSSLTSLTLGNEFDSSIYQHALPPTLTSLVFGQSFNIKISEGVLPSSLKTLTFGDSFNQMIDFGVLPTSLTSLTFNRSCFNHAIQPGVLPGSLGTLILASKYNQTIRRDMLPISLTSLSIIEHISNDDDSTDTTSSSELTRSQLQLPKSLTSLNIRGLSKPIPPGVIPESLLELSLYNCDYNHPVYPGMLPSTLQTLMFGYDFDQRIEPGVLPASLTELIFGQNFKTRLEPGVLPQSITSVLMGDFYTYSGHLAWVAHSIVSRWR
ncbi:hypothetical protein SAMD00019534_108510 [Acytostelium subglobosum LB1]|uniref:hypothetical protein n=1 Tax=Acytostelium subglobosum LB1 TaxID=1410327 RepID=UPI000644F2B8|nr:hypothetical protein SAMD00019534_108510 [Acytostelium subglobosum LB1]GAM27675.1 hypothetical protein SAMD00019534_108510 [Acytostelium subglobosum LB1]|eukprot:XP_012749334.1 hypothetical protein SAMD00019534_108510 [Acytostelium subglobosum LB1]